MPVILKFRTGGTLLLPFSPPGAGAAAFQNRAKPASKVTGVLHTGHSSWVVDRGAPLDARGAAAIRRYEKSSIEQQPLGVVAGLALHGLAEVLVGARRRHPAARRA